MKNAAHVQNLPRKSRVLFPHFSSLFLLLFLPWIRILCRNYYIFLLTLTSRNWDSRGNEGKRIETHFCWVGSLPCPFTQQPLSIQGGFLEWQGLGQVRREETWEVHRQSEIGSWTHCPSTTSKHRYEANDGMVSGPRHKSKVKLLLLTIQSPN